MRSATHRLFFALCPNPTVLRGIEGAVEIVKASKLVRGSWIEVSKLHMTTHFLGDHETAPTAIIERAKAAAAQVKFAPFEFVLDRIASFRGRYKSPCVLRCASASDHVLQTFWRELADALISLGCGHNLERRFTPHVTIAYGDKVLVEPIAITPIAWVVREFVLIESHIGRSRYDILERWPATV